MKIPNITLLILFGCSLAHAQDNHSEALLNAATGKPFTIGSTDFRIVPGASLQSDPPIAKGDSITRHASATAKAAGATPGVLGVVGPYRIVLNSPSVTKAKAARPSNSRHLDPSDLAVAVNMRSGQPAVVTPRLKIFADRASDIANAAAQSGGSLVYASDIDGSGLVQYNSVDAAQTALDEVRKMKNIRGASIDVIEQFKQKQ